MMLSFVHFPMKLDEAMAEEGFFSTLDLRGLSCAIKIDHSSNAIAEDDVTDSCKERHG